MTTIHCHSWREIPGKIERALELCGPKERDLVTSMLMGRMGEDISVEKAAAGIMEVARLLHGWHSAYTFESMVGTLTEIVIVDDDQPHVLRQISANLRAFADRVEHIIGTKF